VQATAIVVSSLLSASAPLSSLIAVLNEKRTHLSSQFSR